MKKGIKIFLCVLLVLVVAVIGVCCWQWDNLMAIKTSLSNSGEDLTGMLESNNAKIEEAVGKVEGVTVRDLTEDEMQALREGKLSRKELLQQLTEKEETAESAGKSQDLLSEYLAEIYMMKAEYTVWLEDKYNEAIAEYSALEESERTASAKYKIGMRCMKEALAKEDECDAQMDAMEQKILTLLEEMGEDTSLVDEIQAAYEKEKELKKAYYLGLHS